MGLFDKFKKKDAMPEPTGSNYNMTGDFLKDEKYYENAISDGI